MKGVDSSSTIHSSSATSVYPGRYTAQIEGPFVVFLLGMRVNKFWQFGKWVLVFRSMNQMLRTLYTDSSTGFLGARVGFTGKGPVLVQYWRSFAELEAFAKAPSHFHRPAWERYNKEIAKSGTAGIWHEAYEVRAGAYECIYTNMPRVGLAKAGEHVAAHNLGHSAAKRIGRSETDEPAVDPTWAEDLSGGTG